jgi:hypothetical protein
MLNDYEIIDFNKYEKNINYKKLYKENNSNIVSFDIINNIEDKMNHSFAEGEKIERVIHFSFKSWYKDMKNSFTKISIKKQFKLDFNRGVYYCNGNLIDDYQNLMDYLEFNFSEKQILDILMFCTQTSLAIPYYYVQRNLNPDNDKVIYYLAEIPNNKNHFRVNFKTDGVFSFILEKRMRIFRLVSHKSKTVSIVNFLLEFNMKSKYVEFKILFKPFVKKK